MRVTDVARGRFTTAFPLGVWWGSYHFILFTQNYVVLYPWTRLAVQLSMLENTLGLMIEHIHYEGCTNPFRFSFC